MRLLLRFMTSSTGMTMLFDGSVPEKDWFARVNSFRFGIKLAP